MTALARAEALFAADEPPFRKGDMARLARRPLLPAVLVTGIERLPWHDGTIYRRPMWRIHWRHVAEGFGHAPQYSDEPRDGRLVHDTAGRAAA